METDHAIFQQIAIDQLTDRIEKLQTIIAAQENLIKEYRELVAILKEAMKA